MKRFAIEITEDSNPNFDLEGKVIIEGDCFRGLIEIAERIDVWNNIPLNIPIECDKCHSFIIDLFILNNAIEDVIEFMESDDFKAEFELYEKAYNRFYDLRYILGKEYYFSDDTEESEEVAIIFDNKCSCNALFVGKDEQQVPVSNSDVPHYHNRKVTKWIGPKDLWN